MHRAFKMEWSDVQVVTLAVSATFLIEDEDDMVVCNAWDQEATSVLDGALLA